MKVISRETTNVAGVPAIRTLWGPGGEEGLGEYRPPLAYLGGEDGYLLEYEAEVPGTVKCIGASAAFKNDEELRAALEFREGQMRQNMADAIRYATEHGNLEGA